MRSDSKIARVCCWYSWCDSRRAKAVTLNMMSQALVFVDSCVWGYIFCPSWERNIPERCWQFTNSKYMLLIFTVWFPNSKDSYPQGDVIRLVVVGSYMWDYISCPSEKEMSPRTAGYSQKARVCCWYAWCDYRSVKAVAMEMILSLQMKKGVFMRTKNRFTIIKDMLLIFTVWFTKSKGNYQECDVIYLWLVKSYMWDYIVCPSEKKNPPENCGQIHKQ